ncbi:potassium translocating ATPase, subunit B [Legionella wadsworthii]|uniref:Potassium-transporting ATPase ATP-binding subunit n=1 Tax=Legionella wadsworthii TaxID=28088 RepID=A0A378LVT1_9GAMM|nr:potassium-transporting ATPase subunit KdpB [Legionella wadsworthii]STY29945.1 potassium translocating ATPase, subunit B [Legionella wadsworthii]
MAIKSHSIWDFHIIKNALCESFFKLKPQVQIKNPVMFTVYISSILTTVLFIKALFGDQDAPVSFIFNISLWLWFTLLFANFAEAMAEGRGKAQAQELRRARQEIQAKRLTKGSKQSKFTIIPSIRLRAGDLVLVESGDFIPSDGEVIEGIASVNESAITGESAPVIRESGGDRSAVTGGTQVLSDWLIIRITSNPGETFLDRMIALVEGAKRLKTPNELALTILLAALTIVFLIVCSTLLSFSIYSVSVTKSGETISITVLLALFVCLAPTSIGALLSAIGIAGMDRMIQANVIALSGRAVEAAGDVDLLLLDKTGTITLGNRQATEFIPAQGVDIKELADAAQLASLADETPEGRSIVVLAKRKYKLRGRTLAHLKATFIPFTAQTRMSGANFGSRQIRKGSAQAIEEYLNHLGAGIPENVIKNVEIISRQGGTALVVTEGAKVLGIIWLKDIIKGGIRERFAQLRQMGIKTIMVTGDNPLTAASIAGEAGVDDFLANAKPEDKLKLIRDMQSQGHLVAMTGDGTNDAPALAQADVAVAMNSGTQAAKEAGNLVDLDSNPTKLIEVVEIGKQLLMTRGALTTFSMANDIAKYFAILPAAFASTYPTLNMLNIMHLSTSKTAILSTVIFNAIIIIFLIPLALRGVKYRRLPAERLLQNNVLFYGLGGLIAPFLGIKAIDMLLTFLGLRG